MNFQDSVSALKENETTTFLETLPLPACIFTELPPTEDGVTDYQLTFANPTWQKTHNLAPENCKVFLASELFTEEDSDAFTNFSQLAKNTMMNGELSHHASVFSLSLHAKTSVLAFKLCDHAIGLLYLDTSLKQHNIARFSPKEHQESRDRYQALVETSNDWIWETDANGYYTYSSPQVKTILGYEIDDIIGQPRWKILKTQSANQQSCAAIALTDAKPYRNITLPTSDSEHRKVILESSANPFFDANGTLLGFRGIDRDVTEKVRLQQELIQTQKMDAIGELAGGIAHDFNNQLGGIVGYTEILKRKIGDTPLRQYLDKILQASQRSADLTNQLLAFARKKVSVISEINIHDTITEVKSILEHTIDKRIRIELRLDANNPLVNGDNTQLQSALLNLVLNARDAMPEGGLLSLKTSNVTLTEQACRMPPYRLASGKHIRIDISDTGHGMTPEIRQHIFDPFFTTKPLGKGTGMGLAAVYGTIDSHKGGIEVNSDPKSGTCFSLFFKSLETNNNQNDSHSEAHDANSYQILFADDENVIREVVSDLLRELGYKTKSFSNGHEALEYYRKNWQNVDLVILDVVMPEMGGREALREMRKINPKLRAMLSTGFSVDNETSDFFKAPLTDFIQKPFKHAELLDMITNILVDP